MLLASIKKCPDKTALQYKKHGKVHNITYSQFGKHIKHLACSFDNFNILPGEKIAILSNNRPEWTITDFAALSNRNIVVPLYQTLPPDQLLYILKDSETRSIFVENDEQYNKIKQISHKLPKIKSIISFEKIDDEDVYYLYDMINNGKEYLTHNPDYYEESIEKIESKEVCTIVYTSGTTGNPKGVMLHHEGFINNIISSENRLNLDDNEVFLSFLPLSHLFERHAGHWTPMYRTNTIFYSESINTVIDDIQVANPTVIVAVPRLYEKISEKVLTQVEHGSPLKKKLFFWALDVGKTYHRQKHENKIGLILEKKYSLADKIVFSKIKKKLGGKLKFPIAGGAPLSTKTLKFFEAMGLPIIEGYGMTETHLVLTLTPAEKIRYGSCGKPINIVDMKISEDGEVLVKCPLMAGYYKKPKETKEMIDNDGWLHTGDIGYIDHDNFLFLTDRKKNILITAGGKNVASAPIELLIKRSRYIEETCLLGDKQKFISALVIPNFDNLRKWAKSKNLNTSTNEILISHSETKKFIWEEVEEMQSKLARFEKIKKIALLPEMFTLEKEELTPSLKIKRKVIYEHYKDIISKIYENSNVV